MLLLQKLEVELFLLLLVELLELLLQEKQEAGVRACRSRAASRGASEDPTPQQLVRRLFTCTLPAVT